MKMSDRYSPGEVEQKLYERWEKNGYFSEDDKNDKYFSIVLPPPNITGSLHLGHALNHTIQDSLIRWKKMNGYRAVWLPGTDHAGIATQMQVEKALAKQKKTRQMIGREKFLEQVWEWKHKYGNQIVHQMKRLGSACDWNRHLFTLDDVSVKAVKKVFVHLYKKGWIYKGTRLVNWSPALSSAISDLEVEHKEVSSSLWYIRYYLEDKKNYLVIATTRPETLLADQALAVHPEDERYKEYHGKKVHLPLVNKLIPIITDSYVDKGFGTGALKITPAHDFNDYEIGKKHGLENFNILNIDGRLNENAGNYTGLKVAEARKKVVQDLEDQKLLEKIESYKHQVGFCSRSGSVVEPYLSEQWFVKMDQLAENGLKKVLQKETEFIPEYWLKTFEHWMNNIQDWCISRQLWWGHRIPCWTCSDCGEVTVCEEAVEKCNSCSSKNIKQDEDVLDTWFSSALWPMSTLGWPDKTVNQDNYPTSVLVTAPDILFFWVARMIMMSLEFQSQVPFRHVYLHGVVRDAQGRKMSKTLGNGEDPIDLIEEYGADALRLFLLDEHRMGQDIRFSRENLKTCRNFMNKIWNSARFVHQNFKMDLKKPQNDELSIMDQWILQKLQKTEKEVSKELHDYKFSSACTKLYRFAWLEFCDWYLEWVRSVLYGKVISENTEDNYTVWKAGEKPLENTEKLSVSYYVLCYTLNRLLRLLHPFIPFITEEIYQTWPIKDKESIMLDTYPGEDGHFLHSKTSKETQVEFIRDIVVAIRTLRGENNIKPSAQIDVELYLEDVKDLEKITQTIKGSISNIFFLEKLNSLKIVDQINPKPSAIMNLSPDVKIIIPLEGLVDLASEKKRLEKQIKKCEENLNKLQNQITSFSEKVPERVRKDKKDQAESLRNSLKSLHSSLERFNK
ncbi:MAG: valine--tRNA ligase [Bdellovibrionales bacterium]|nr:valine--tRNA ligase [Bdellovibrionales bacterium]